MSRTSKTEQPEPDADEKPVRLAIPPSFHSRLRVLAAQHEMSMSAYVREVIIRHIDEKDTGTK